MRKTISTIVGILMIIGAIFAAKTIINSKKKHKPHATVNVTSVYTQVVKNKSIPITISSSGKLVAKDRVELYSEVQGILEKSGKDYRAGNYYNKGELILKINSDEFYSSINENLPPET